MNFLTYTPFDFPYNEKYHDPALRGIDEIRPWNLSKEIIKLSDKNKNLLDLGCGSASKIIPVASHFKSIIGLDHNEKMLELANNSIRQQGIQNIELVLGKVNDIPLPSNSIDFVTSILAPHDISEINRVLKPGGYFLIETIGELDKKELKLFFENGEKIRGQFSERPTGFTSLIYAKELNVLYENVYIEEGFWNTLYTAEGVLALLMSTPTILDFDINNDKKSFEKAVNYLPKKDNLIMLRQHRLLITGKKPF